MTGHIDAEFEEDIETQSGEPPPQGDLGLGALSDDQLLTLAEQARMEIWSRGFILFEKIWMASVERQNQEFEDRMTAWQGAIERIRFERQQEIADEVREKITELAGGTLKGIVPQEMEDAITTSTTLNTKLALLDAYRMKIAEEIGGRYAGQSAGMGDLMPGQFSVPQNPMPMTSTTSYSGPAFRTPTPSNAGQSAYPSAYPRGGRP